MDSRTVFVTIDLLVVSIIVVVVMLLLLRPLSETELRAYVIKAARYCPHCGTVGLVGSRSFRAVGFGSGGAFSMIGGSVPACRACGSTGVIPLDTPVAEAALGRRAEEVFKELVLYHTGRL